MDIEESILRIYGIAVIISALIGIVETNAMLFAPSFLFRFGLRIKTMQGIHINLESFEIGQEYKTPHVKFVRYSKNSCLFSRRFGFFSNAHVAIKARNFTDRICNYADLENSFRFHPVFLALVVRLD